MPAAGRGHLRASHADREQVIGILKAAFVQGRLTKDEFDQRVSQTFASRTYADLAVPTAGIPAWLTPARLPVQPARPAANKVLLWIEFLTMAAAIGFGALFFNPAGLAVTVLTLLIIGPVAGTQILESWRQRRSSGRPLPPPPAPALPSA